MENIGKVFKQNCGDYLKIVEKTNKKKNGKFLYKGVFQKYNYEVFDLISSIKLGKVNNPQIEKVEFIDKIWPQHCGDSLKIIKKSDIKKNNTYLWECEFINTKEIIFCKKDSIIKGQIQKIDNFIGKEFLQNCGDTLKILKLIDKRIDTLGKSHNIYECKFLKYPYLINSEKQNIINGNVNNPLIEENEFIGKKYFQNCGEYLTVIKKTTIQNKKGGNFLFECKFYGKYPFTCLKSKNEILKGEVDNLSLPWKTKEGLENYIIKNFDNKPTLNELSNSLNISISHLSNIINNFSLQDKIKYYSTNSEEELNIKEFIQNLLKQKIFNNWNELDGKEIDIYIPNLRLGFEYNGNYWHCNFQKSINYHQEKSLFAKEKNIQLIHIFEYEWNNKREIFESFIKSKIGIFYKKIGARKCLIKVLSNKEYQDFCNKNHFQGECGAKIKLGLFYKDELVQIMSFGVPRFTDKYEWEILRECSKLGYIIIGGKERLWKYFVKNYNPNSVISYCDFGKFDGHSYLKLGFDLLRLNEPGFVWYDEKNNQVFWRNPFKHKEFKDKYLKIYDAGQLVFIWNKI